MKRSTTALRHTPMLAKAPIHKKAKPKLKLHGRGEKTKTSQTRVKDINLALQGGGAHGAFAWGVLDYFLEDGRVKFEAISATSAGAMNAAVCAHGMLNGGPEGARAALHHFWKDISDTGKKYSPIRPSLWNQMTGNHCLEDSPSFMMFGMLSRLFSPYQLNPRNFNPLRQVLEKHVDFEALRSAKDAVQLHISATNVETGKVRIFRNPEMTPDTVLASACVPILYQAVEIDGEFFWDGGYMGNPAIFPLMHESTSRDVVIVHINPIVRKGCPKTAAEIMNRVNELSFNSTLMREMHAVASVRNMVGNGHLKRGSFKEMYIHSIRTDEFMSKLGVSSKLSNDWRFLCDLRDDGRKAARAWLDVHFDQIGKETTIDLQKEFL